MSSGRLILAGIVAAIAVLVAPALALGQASVVTLREAPDSGFPDKAFILRLPERKALTTSQVTVNENGTAVTGLAVEPPGSTTGTILLIDASNSMEGAPIAGAVQAARAFIAQRNQRLPVAVVVFGPDETVLADFTTDQVELFAALSVTPELAEGTHIYDTLVRAAELAAAENLERATVVLLSDGTDVGSNATLADALTGLADANVRVISVGLKSKQYDPAALRSIAQQTGGTYAESASPADLEPIFSQISSQLASEYTVTYRSLLPPVRQASVSATVVGYAPATATYTTPALDLTDKGTFERDWLDNFVTSRYLMLFIVCSVIALIGFAILTAFDVRSRSIRRRMAQYVSIPTDDESRLRRAEVAAMLAERAQRRVARLRWWQSFERDIELGDVPASPVSIAGWTLIAGVVTSLVVAIAFQSAVGLLVGFLAPLVTRTVIKARVSRKRGAFGAQLPDNLEVLAGALRAGHSIAGAFNVMAEGAEEPSRTEFKRVLQDEQLGVPMDQALTVMSRRMDNPDSEQVAIVTRLQREAGGNTAEVLDRVVENIRGRMELRRLVDVLTAQGRLARWVLTGLPFVLVAFLLLVNPDWLDPLWNTDIGRAFLVLWAVMLVAGSFAIKRVVRITV